jgi:predicted amidophosphoribosyltransferase
VALQNCSRCGKLFNRLSRDVCQDCVDLEDSYLRETQRYLRENRNATAAEVLIDLNEVGFDVEQRMLEKWVKEKRINLKLETDETEAKRLCPLCQREIKDHEKICRTCQMKKIMSGKTQSPSSPSTPKKEEPEATKRPGMHYKKRT